jgi:Flp pilus assembly pilin Flp
VGKLRRRVAGAHKQEWDSQFEEIVMRKIVAFLKDESGTETLEWGLVCGLIVVGAIVAIAAIGPKVTDMWNDTNAAIPVAD